MDILKSASAVKYNYQPNDTIHLSSDPLNAGLKSADLIWHLFCRDQGDTYKRCYVLVMKIP